MKYINILITVFLVIFSATLKSQDLKEGSYDLRIRTAKIFKTGNVMSDAVVELNGSETITLLFDEISPLDESPVDYYYTVSHCDADWNEEQLLFSEYASGFEENKFRTFTSSSNSAVKYINYRLMIPNADIRLKFSGNYLIKVYNGDTRELVLKKGFSVLEPFSSILATVRNFPGNNESQQIDFKVDHQRLKVDDAYINLKVRVKQNNKSVSGVAKPIPAFTTPGITDFTRSDRNIYPGGNEFRAFDTRDLTYTKQGVSDITKVNGVYRVVLNKDGIRDGSQYLNNPDANGKYLIAAERTFNADTQGEYTDVYFSLSTPFPLNGKVFVYGELTDWEIKSEAEMAYNAQSSSYECDMMLKQGYYNYKYAVVNDSKIDFKETEGSFRDTENAYAIYVYYKPPGARFDRLVGYRYLPSRSY